MATLLTACSGGHDDKAPTEAPATAVLYYNGNFITMDEAVPDAEALAVSDGTIIAVGEEAAVRRQNLTFEREVDLQGNTVLPGFIDAHGHFSLAAKYIDYVNIASPPVGPANNIADIIALLKAEKSRLADNEWLVTATDIVTTELGKQDRRTVMIHARRA